MRVQTLFFMILALASLPAAAAMYKWTDADGNTQYGQHPPGGVDAQRIQKDPAPKSAAPAAPAGSPQQRLKALEQQQTDEDEQAQMEAVDAEREALRKDNCAKARKTKELLGRGGNRRYRLPDGTVTRLSDEEVEQRIKEAEGHIKEYCD